MSRSGATPFFERGRDKGSFFVGPLYFTRGALLLGWLVAAVLLALVGTCPPVFMWSPVIAVVGVLLLVVGGIGWGIYWSVVGVRAWLENSADQRDRLNGRN